MGGRATWMADCGRLTATPGAIVAVGTGEPATLDNHESHSLCCTTGHLGQTQ